VSIIAVWLAVKGLEWHNLVRHSLRKMSKAREGRECADGIRNSELGSR
jgi:hypothetical protein